MENKVCKSCGTPNEKGAKFCRVCGKPLNRPEDDIIQNIMDLNPDYKFRPTSMMEWKKPMVANFIWRICLCGLIFFLIWFSYCVYAYYYPNSNMEVVDNEHEVTYIYRLTDSFGEFYGSTGDYYNGYSGYDSVERAYDSALAEYHQDLEPYIFTWIGIAFFAPFVWLFKRKQPTGKTPKLSELADYIEDYSYSGIRYGRRKQLYKYFFKDNKIGIMNVSQYKVQIPAEYDSLSWREEGKILTAKQNGVVKTIDIYGNILR